jgi:hypothetical protein
VVPLSPLPSLLAAVITMPSDGGIKVPLRLGTSERKDRSGKRGAAVECSSARPAKEIFSGLPEAARRSMIGPVAERLPRDLKEQLAPRLNR